MVGLTRLQTGLVATGLLLAAIASGTLLAQLDEPELLVGAAAFGLVAVITFDKPIFGFLGIVAILGLVPETGRDDRLLGTTDLVYGPAVMGVDAPLMLLMLLTVALALGLRPGQRWWPGAPAAIALALLLVGVACSVWYGPLLPSLHVTRPLLILVAAIFAGYWLTIRYGSQPLLKAFVLAAVVAIPGGFYNVAAGDVSYYDASFVYLIGVAAVLVLFRVVEIGFLRAPFLILSVLLIALSFRRGAMITVAAAFLAAGLLYGRGGFRTSVGLVLGTVIALELMWPEIVVSRVEAFGSYFTGASGYDWSVNQRRFETANAWMNVERNWLFGIGPTGDWSLYRIFDGKFVPDYRDYLHHSYLWVWLRYGLLGMLLYVAFLAVSAGLLLRKSAPLVSVVVGGSIAGLAVALVTASWLTTTSRWPLTVGLLLGIALAARDQGRDAVSPSESRVRRAGIVRPFT